MAKTETSRVHVVLPTDLLERVDELVGPRGRSQFMAEATTELVRRKRMLKALDEMSGSLVGADTPPEWDTPEGTSAWVRKLREESDDRLGDWLPKPDSQS
jgi:hypothetical protein